MGWESRNGSGRYYTRSRRVNGRVERTYVPVSLAAVMAQVDALERLSKRLAQEQVRAEWQREREEAEELDEAVSAFFEEAEAAFRDAMEAAGYHRHARGEWRRKRRED